MKTLCTGTPATLASLDVSARFGAAAGTSVTRVSDGVTSNFLTYYDVPRWIPWASKFLFNRGGSNKLELLAGGPGATNADVLLTFDPAPGGLPGYNLSPDGVFLVYTAMNDASTYDLYGLRLDQPGQCRDLVRRITNLSISSDRRTEVSPPTLAVGSNNYVIALGVEPGTSDRSHLYVVNSDGTNPLSSSKRERLDVSLDEPEADLGWHRVRMNPRFENVIFYRHQADDNSGGTENLYVVDWTETPPHARAWCTTCNTGVHPIWTPDGTMMAVAGTWTEIGLVGADGKIPAGLGAVYPDQGKQVGPFGKPGSGYLPIMYGSYSPDGSQIAVVTTPLQDDTGGKIYRMDRAGNVQYLSEAHSRFTLIKGQPRLGFLGDSSQIVFSSDDSYGSRTSAAGAPQLFLVQQASR